MKRIIPWLLLAALVLSGCGRARAGEALQARYALLRSAELTAEVICRPGRESRSFDLSCAWDAEGGSTVTVTAPAELAGITASVSGEDLTLTYGDLSLAAGTLTDLSPANCLPWLLRAAASGYVLEEGREKLEGRDCLRLTLDTTAPSGEKTAVAAWFDGETLEPVYAEFTMAEALVLSAEITSFRGEWSAPED